MELATVERATTTRPDGLQVDYFTLPAQGRRRRAPVHLEVHGGPQGWWPASWGLALHQSLAAAGYVVVLPNPRGSGGYGQDFARANHGDWGGEDYEDILACCDDVVARGLGDARRMYVSGYSYGGFMTAWIVGHTDRFLAAASCAPVVDQQSMALTTDIPEFAVFSNGGDPWRRADAYRQGSPLTYLPEVTTPVMVMHWEGDLRCPIGQGEELWSGLRLLGREAELVHYPGGAHGVHTPSQDVDRVSPIIAWNQAHDLTVTRSA
ncbi:MAG: alpha/beta hydrolase family protein [Acidimicrobiales bacterium]